MTFEMEHAVVAALTKSDGEPYTLLANEGEGVLGVLTRVVTGPNAVAEIRRTLALAVGLRQLGAPTAADAIEALIKREPYAVALISDHLLRSGALDETRAFFAREDRAQELRAPKIDETRAPSGVRVADFLDPGRHMEKGANREWQKTSSATIARKASVPRIESRPTTNPDN